MSLKFGFKEFLFPGKIIEDNFHPDLLQKILFSFMFCPDTDRFHDHNDKQDKKNLANNFFDNHRLGFMYRIDRKRKRSAV